MDTWLLLITRQEVAGSILIQGIQGGDDDSANETEEQEYSAEKK